MPNEQQYLKVFLCHAHSDKEAVRNLYQRLTKDGVDAWLDKEKLLPGQDWEYEIRKAVRGSDVVVVCLSKQFNQAGFRQKEVRLALDTAMEKPEGNIFIIPARLEECESLESLRKWHWVDLFEEDGYEMLMRALRVRADEIGARLQARKTRTPKNRKPKEIISEEKEKAKTNTFEPINSNSNSMIKTNQIDKTEQFEQTLEEKEEIEKRRLPYLEKPINKGSTEQQSGEISEIPNKAGKHVDLIVSSAEHKSEKHSSIGKKPKNKQGIKTPYVVAIIGALATILAGLLSSPLSQKWFSPTAIPTIFETATVAVANSTASPSQTSEPSRLQTATLTPTHTPLPTEITDAKGVPMMLVPAGEFTMGHPADDAYGFCITISTHIEWHNYPCSKEDYLREEPVHKVNLNNYFMDVFETSNDEYKKCVSEGSCQQPSSNSSNLYSNYYDNKNFLKYPVINITWEMAEKYCEWRGARLPTEAEWEKAARGTEGRTHPWGNYNPAYRLYDPAFYKNKANIGLGNTSGPVSVDYNSQGLSPYGLYNMAGNVAEWVADWYSESYYGISPYENPSGPSSGENKVIRGGSFTYASDIRTSARDYRTPSTYENSIGFRCAKDANP